MTFDVRASDGLSRSIHRWLRCLTIALGCAGPLAQALEFRSVGAPAAILYDAPSGTANKIAIVTQYYPLEVISRQGDWLKVRDPSGELSWAEAKALSERRTVMVIAPSADVREAARENAPVVFRVEKNIALDLAEPPTSSWIKVRHRDGQTGYIRIEQIWGL